MPDKQSRELFQLELFLPELLRNRPYTLLQPAPPHPDAVIEVDGRIVGIETTVLIMNELVKQREAAQDAILNQAQKLFEEEHQMPLHVTVDFIESANWKSLNRERVASFLATTISQWVQKLKDIPQYQSQFDIQTDGLDHEYIQQMIVSYSSKWIMPCWSPIEGFVVPQAPTQIIQDIICRKTKNFTGYLTGCDEVWLLIIETGSPSSYYEHYNELQKVEFESGFARTLIGRISKGELLELRTKPHEI